MNTEFCMNCGAKAEYTLKAPNFCPSCGNPFNKVNKASTQAVAAEPVEPESAPASIPQLSKLDYTIGPAGGTTTFGDLVSTASSSSLPYEKAPARPAPKAVPNEDIIQQTMNECRSAREPQDIGE